MTDCWNQQTRRCEKIYLTNNIVSVILSHPNVPDVDIDAAGILEYSKENYD